jgi:hypothetical protein
VTMVPGQGLLAGGASGSCGQLSAVEWIPPRPPTWAAPDGLDSGPKGTAPERPSIAGVYDGLMGGYHQFAADREMQGRLLAALPDAAYWAWANRGFVERATRFVLAAGVRQILDIGSGLPATVGSVHETAHEVAPDTRVVYVDIDPIVVANVPENTSVIAVLGDVRDPNAILGHPHVTEVLDFSQPVAILLASVLHFVADWADPPGILAQFLDATVTGSYLIISHASPMADLTPEQEEAIAAYCELTAPLTLRSREQVIRLFDGWRLVDPGVCGVAFWHPDREATLKPPELARAERIPGWVGVAVKLGQLDGR